MENLGQLPRFRGVATCKSWLDRPLSSFWCVLGWLGASTIFVGLIALLGGPSESDGAASVFSTWAEAHGNFSCAYPPASSFKFPLTGPLYPLVSAGFSRLLRIGHGVAFPTQHQLGRNCSRAFLAISHWAVLSGSWLPMVRLGYLSWFALMAGLIAILRATGRGRCGWEPAILVLVACIPSVFASILVYFHPQDILAMGLALVGVAFARRNCWLRAGIVLALAVCSQQFTILVLTPLIIIAPSSQRWKFLGALVATAALIDIPLFIESSGRAATAIFGGTGFSGALGDTLIDNIGIHGTLLTVASRACPIIVTIGLAWWAKRKIGSASLEPVPLLSLIATALCSRLLFEVDLWGYYFLAVSVALVVLDAASGKIRGTLIAWLALVTLVFNPVIWSTTTTGQSSGIHLYRSVPIIFITLMMLCIIADVLHRKIRWYRVVWILLVFYTTLVGGWINDPAGHGFPMWIWQIVLISAAIALSVNPLMSTARHSSRDESVREVS